MSKAIILALVAMVAVGVPFSSSAASLRSDVRGKVTVRATETNERHAVDGGVSGKGTFTISGVITDKGSVTDYRSQKGMKALVRRVAVGRNGTITFLITIDMNTGSETWTIGSASKRYKGLSGKGKEVIDDWSSKPAKYVLTGTVSQ